MLTGALQFAIRGYSEPSGEAQLYGLGQAFRSGDLGFDVRAQQFIQPAADVTLMIDQIEEPGHRLGGVFVLSGDDVVSAAQGTVHFSGRGTMLLTLNDGVLTRQRGTTRTVAVRFASLGIVLPVPHTSPRREPMADVLSRLDNRALQTLVRVDDQAKMVSRAVLVERWASALFCLGLPFLACGASIPPKKSTSSLGLALGLFAIIASCVARHRLPTRLHNEHFQGSRYTGCPV